MRVGNYKLKYEIYFLLSGVYNILLLVFHKKNSMDYVKNITIIIYFKPEFVKHPSLVLLRKMFCLPLFLFNQIPNNSF